MVDFRVVKSNASGKIAHGNVDGVGFDLVDSGRRLDITLVDAIGKPLRTQNSKLVGHVLAEYYKQNIV